MLDGRQGLAGVMLLPVQLLERFRRRELNGEEGVRSTRQGGETNSRSAPFGGARRRDDLAMKRLQGGRVPGGGGADRLERHAIGEMEVLDLEI